MCATFATVRGELRSAIAAGVPSSSLSFQAPSTFAEQM
ncbi:hypothetical protein PHIGD57-1_26 [Mycobacterium phage phiGD57-1]|nr:hypothetical protein PHIGD57-1_26 [Mycobacterium phage phiGD57-1]QST88917.1 hypothetical protein PROPHIGD57-1_65 [Mycobacterium phage prophiGD25-1]QST89723.1 hypothetical protein PROPHIGD57-1_65 [Mycobacterium phage prophi57-1]